MNKYVKGIEFKINILNFICYLKHFVDFKMKFKSR